MRKFITIAITAVLMMSCASHDDLVLKYGEVFYQDIRYNNQYHARVDSLNQLRYEEGKITLEEKEKKDFENFVQFLANRDYAEFRFAYFTTKGIKRIVDRRIEDWNHFEYKGEFFTYDITRKPRKKGISENRYEIIGPGETDFWWNQLNKGK